MSDAAQSELCRRLLGGCVMERVRERLPRQITAPQLVNSMRRTCVGLREMCDSQREAMAATGQQLDAERFAIEDVLLEELESWFD